VFSIDSLRFSCLYLCKFCVEVGYLPRMEEASSIDSSHTSSLSKFFDKEVILTMRYLMKEMCEDRNESIALEE
jgi:hypothetical protein